MKRNFFLLCFLIISSAIFLPGNSCAANDNGEKMIANECAFLYNAIINDPKLKQFVMYLKYPNPKLNYRALQHPAQTKYSSNTENNSAKLKIYVLAGEFNIPLSTRSDYDITISIDNKLKNSVIAAIKDLTIISQNQMVNKIKIDGTITDCIKSIDKLDKQWLNIDKLQNAYQMLKTMRSVLVHELCHPLLFPYHGFIDRTTSPHKVTATGEGIVTLLAYNFEHDQGYIKNEEEYFMLSSAAYQSSYDNVKKIMRKGTDINYVDYIDWQEQRVIKHQSPDYVFAIIAAIIKEYTTTSNAYRKDSLCWEMAKYIKNREDAKAFLESALPLKNKLLGIVYENGKLTSEKEIIYTLSDASDVSAFTGLFMAKMKSVKINSDTVFKYQGNKIDGSGRFSDDTVKERDGRTVIFCNVLVYKDNVKLPSIGLSRQSQTCILSSNKETGACQNVNK